MRQRRPNVLSPDGLKTDQRCDPNAHLRCPNMPEIGIRARFYNPPHRGFHLVSSLWAQGDLATRRGYSMSVRWRPSKKALGSEHLRSRRASRTSPASSGSKGFLRSLSRSSTPRLRAEEVSGVVAAATLRACAGGRRAQPSFVARCAVTSCACLSAQPAASFGGDACAPKYIEPISTAIRATRRTTGVRLAHERVGQQAGVSLRALKQPAPAVLDSIPVALM